MRVGNKDGQEKYWEAKILLSIIMTCFFNLYAEYLMRNAGLEEAQAGIKTSRRNVNKIRYAYDTTLWQKVTTN